MKMTNEIVTGVFEWAKYGEFCFDGCEHGCLYCWAKAKALKMGWVPSADKWPKMVLNQKRFDKNFGKRAGTTMFPTNHDITPDTMRENITYLLKMLAPGNKVLIVSKPHAGVVKHLCYALTNYKNQILFRFTIGSPNEPVLKFWEPNAPSYAERKEALMEAFNRGFQTSVSSEPFLDENIGILVEELKPFVTDAIWIGKMNKIAERVDMTGWGPAEFAYLVRVKKSQTDAAIHTLYEHYKNDPKVKWKDSIKKIVGIARPTKAGADE